MRLCIGRFDLIHRRTDRIGRGLCLVDRRDVDRLFLGGHQLRLSRGGRRGGRVSLDRVVDLVVLVGHRRAARIFRLDLHRTVIRLDDDRSVGLSATVIGKRQRAGAAEQRDAADERGDQRAADATRTLECLIGGDRRQALVLAVLPEIQVDVAVMLPRRGRGLFEVVVVATIVLAGKRLELHLVGSRARLGLTLRSAGRAARSRLPNGCARRPWLSGSPVPRRATPVGRSRRNRPRCRHRQRPA